MVDTVLTDLIKDAKSDDGVMDAMLQKVKTALQEEYDSSRITGADYANVYLGLLQSMMAQAVSYSLGLRTTNAQAALLEAQEASEGQRLLQLVEETLLTTEQKNLAIAQTAKTNEDKLLVTQQIATEVNETARVAAQTDEIIAREALLVQQRLTEIQNTSLVTSTKLKTDAETNLIQQQLLTEVQNTARVTAETTRINSDKLRIDAETTLLGSKNATELAIELKVDQETALLAEKQATEFAQTHDTNLVGGGAVAGIVGAQTLLYERQADGFLRDAEQKVGKIVMDAWAISASVDPSGTAPRPSTVLNTDIDNVMTKLYAGINVTPAP